MLTSDHDGAVLLVGGYGVVGTELARLLHARHPDLGVLLAGRDPGRGRDLAAGTGAGLLTWDLTGPVPDARVRLVVSLTNDLGDAALAAALAAGVPYVDITRWTSRLHAAHLRLTAEPPAAAAVLASGWMGGVVPRLVAHLAVAGDRVDVAIRYDLRDSSGADSVEYLDRLGVEFTVPVDGGERLVTPLTDARTVDIGGDRVRVARIDTPEQVTLPARLGLSGCATRIGFSEPAATTTLLALRRIGFFRWARGEKWRGLRRRILHSSGAGGEARIRIDVAGVGGRVGALVVDPAGQAHLTAVGALMAIRQALAAGPGVRFPEDDATDGLPELLADLGVEVVLTREP
ncbi:hypothetical protein ACWKSP_02545 [Micromonosporaceae bacterium Da 78-11]